MTEISRRTVLGAGAALVGGLVVGLDAAPAVAGGAARPAPKPAHPASSLARSHYTSSVGKTFTITRDGHSHRVTLKRIVNVEGATKKQADSCFNLIFTARSRLPEGIYTVTRRGVPSHHLFLGSLGHGTALQALVNRSR